MWLIRPHSSSYEHAQLASRCLSYQLSRIGRSKASLKLWSWILNQPTARPSHSKKPRCPLLKILICEHEAICRSTTNRKTLLTPSVYLKRRGILIQDTALPMPAWVRPTGGNTRRRSKPNGLTPPRKPAEKRSLLTKSSQQRMAVWRRSTAEQDIMKKRSRNFSVRCKASRRTTSFAENLLVRRRGSVRFWMLRRHSNKPLHCGLITGQTITRLDTFISTRAVTQMPLKCSLRS